MCFIACGLTDNDCVPFRCITCMPLSSAGTDCASAPTDTGAVFLGCGTNRPAGTVCQSAFCQAGFAGGPVIATCSGFGTWTYEGQRRKPCTGTPPAFLNGAWSCNTQVCSGVCSSGFLGTPATPTASCSQAGAWETSGAVCDRGCSGNPAGTVANGAFACPPLTPKGGRCTALCLPGFEGSVSATCSTTAFGATTTWGAIDASSPCTAGEVPARRKLWCYSETAKLK